MEKSFLRLSLKHRQTEAREDFYQWEYSQLSQHFQLIDKHDFESVDDDVRHKLRRGDWSSQQDRLARMPADELFQNIPAAVISGLPGAGKTTILRHCAWQAFRANAEAAVVLIEAKHLTDSHIATKGRDKQKLDPLCIEHIFKVIASLFLKPGCELSKLKERDADEVHRTAAWLLSEWRARRAVVLLDVLDEGPSEAIRQWLAGAANKLMDELWPRRIGEDESRAELPTGRCLLSLRAAELERSRAVSLTGGPIFLVNALDQEQIREIARRQLKAMPERFNDFDERLPYRQDIQKVAGTPLTALLIIFFFEFSGRFERRFISYQLLVAFVLEKAWRRIQRGQFAASGTNLTPFMQDAREPDFLLSRPEVGLQYRALAYVARRCLYHQVKKQGARERSERTISREELLAQLTSWIKQEKHAWLDAHDADGLPWPESADAGLWFRSWETENLLLPSGPNHVVFMHSTVMEFFAAVGIGELLERSAFEGTPLGLPSLFHTSF